MFKPDLVSSILKWFGEAYPEPAEKNVQTQIGVHLEEVAEMLRTFKAGNNDTHVRLVSAISAIHGLAEHTKEKGGLVIEQEAHTELLDALCDQMVTSIGVAHMLGYGIYDALYEVNQSNFSKFVGGIAIFDMNKKVVKGMAYFKPNLQKFTGRK